MTRKEAIESLERDIHNSRISGHQTSHYEMAIKALEGEPKLEKIKRIVNQWNNDASHSFSNMCKINEILKG